MVPKLKIAISACLLGEKVRYDGAEKRAEELVAALEAECEWVPVCPEVGAGLGTPREPMHLERVGDEVRVLTNETRRDNTPALEAFARAELPRLIALGVAGFIMKSRSPSCGLYDVPITAAGDLPDLGAGHFAFRLAGTEPLMPFADEQELADPQRRERFLVRVRDFVRRRATEVQ